MLGRRGCLWTIGVVVVVVVAAVVGLDFGTKALAEHELATRAQSASDAQSASASVSGFPFLWDVFEEGVVHGVSLQLFGVPVGPLRLQELQVALTGTHIERSALLDHRQVRVTSIDSGTATVTVTASELSSAIGHTVSLPGNGLVFVDVSSAMIRANVTIVSDVLEVQVAGVSLLESNLASNRFIPACALALDIGAGELTVSCQMSPVPATIVQAISGT